MSSPYHVSDVVLGTTKEKRNATLRSSGGIDRITVETVSNKPVSRQSDPLALVFVAVLADPLHFTVAFYWLGGFSDR
jgi:hypothetical protein